MIVFWQRAFQWSQHFDSCTIHKVHSFIYLITNKTFINYQILLCMSLGVGHTMMNMRAFFSSEYLQLLWEVKDLLSQSVLIAMVETEMIKSLTVWHRYRPHRMTACCISKKGHWATSLDLRALWHILGKEMASLTWPRQPPWRVTCTAWRNSCVPSGVEFSQ